MMKVNSQNDRVQLDKAKEITYLRGFYEGVWMYNGNSDGDPILLFR